MTQITDPPPGRTCRSPVSKPRGTGPQPVKPPRHVPAALPTLVAHTHAPRRARARATDRSRAARAAHPLGLTRR